MVLDASHTSWLGDVPDIHQLTRVAFRLLVAMVAGALIGAQRESTGKFAGLRTHMLVALGSAVFVLGASEHGFGEDAVSRVIQGIVTGIGFLGAGAILKLTSEHTVKGLTTAGSIWVTAAIGIATGLGQYAITVVSVPLTWLVLAIFVKVENRLKPARKDHDTL